jgi:hypothetical protein
MADEVKPPAKMERRVVARFLGLVAAGFVGLAIVIGYEREYVGSAVALTIGLLIFLCGVYWDRIRTVLGPALAVSVYKIASSAVSWLIVLFIIFCYLAAPTFIGRTVSSIETIRRHGEQDSIKVPENVQNAFDATIEPRLGKRISDIITLPTASYVVLDNTDAIWTTIPKIQMIFLRLDSKVIYHSDPSPVDDERYFDNDALRKLTKTPKNKCPPMGGLARLWEINRKEWEWTGYRVIEYHYNYIKQNIYGII